MSRLSAGRDSRYAVVGIFINDFPAATGDVFAQLAELHFWVLAAKGGHSGVKGGAHVVLPFTELKYVVYRSQLKSTGMVGMSVRNGANSRGVLWPIFVPARIPVFGQNQKAYPDATRTAVAGTGPWGRACK
jgi:hypothetical protein